MRELRNLHHLKVPVSDVRASSEWYCRTLGLRVEIEFAEEGELRGVALTDASGETRIALRHDPDRAAALAGFDLAALLVPTREGVRAWAKHLDDLEQPYGEIVTGHRGGSVLTGLHDPDGIELRLYAD